MSANIVQMSEAAYLSFLRIETERDNFRRMFADLDTDQLAEIWTEGAIESCVHVEGDGACRACIVMKMKALIRQFADDAEAARK